MAKQAIVAFVGEDFSFRLYVFLRRHKFLILFPVVRHALGNQRTLNQLPQLLPKYDLDKRGRESLFRVEDGSPPTTYGDDRVRLSFPTSLIGNLSESFSDGYLPQTRRYDKSGMDTRLKPRV